MIKYANLNSQRVSVFNCVTKGGHMSTSTRTVYRDSGTGKILSKDQALAKDPKTVEKERIKYPSPKTKK